MSDQASGPFQKAMDAVFAVMNHRRRNRQMVRAGQDQEAIWADHDNPRCPVFYIENGVMFVDAEELLAWKRELGKRDSTPHDFASDAKAE